MSKQYQEFAINYYQDADGIFTAQVPAIRGCVASGRTLEQAYRNAADAIESCLEARAKVAATAPLSMLVPSALLVGPQPFKNHRSNFRR